MIQDPSQVRKRLCRIGKTILRLWRILVNLLHSVCEPAGRIGNAVMQKFSNNRFMTGFVLCALVIFGLPRLFTSILSITPEISRQATYL